MPIATWSPVEKASRRDWFAWDRVENEPDGGREPDERHGQLQPLDRHRGGTFDHDEAQDKIRAGTAPRLQDDPRAAGLEGEVVEVCSEDERLCQGVGARCQAGGDRSHVRVALEELLQRGCSVDSADVGGGDVEGAASAVEAGQFREVLEGRHAGGNCRGLAPGDEGDGAGPHSRAVRGLGRSADAGRIDEVGHAWAEGEAPEVSRVERAARRGRRQCHRDAGRGPQGRELYRGSGWGRCRSLPDPKIQLLSTGIPRRQRAGDRHGLGGGVVPLRERGDDAGGRGDVVGAGGGARGAGRQASGVAEQLDRLAGQGVVVAVDGGLGKREDQVAAAVGGREDQLVQEGGVVVGPDDGGDPGRVDAGDLHPDELVLCPEVAAGRRRFARAWGRGLGDEADLQRCGGVQPHAGGVNVQADGLLPGCFDLRPGSRAVRGLRRPADEVLEDPEALHGVRPPERHVGQGGILEGRNLLLDGEEIHQLAGDLRRRAGRRRGRGNPEGVGRLVEPIRLAGQIDRRVEVEAFPAEVERPGADGQVAGGGALRAPGGRHRGDGIAAGRRADGSHDVERGRPVPLSVDACGLVPVGLDGDPSLLCHQTPPFAAGVVAHTCTVAAHLAPLRRDYLRWLAGGTGFRAEAEGR